MKNHISINTLLYYPVGLYRLWKKTAGIKQKITKSPIVYLLNVPSHGNLGDHLISVAEQQFLSDNFPNLNVVCITSADLYFSTKIALRMVRQNDLLVMTGGGYLGSLYREEFYFMKILQLFPNNNIIVFPQTVYYGKDARSQRMYRSALAVYNNRKRLYFIARDNSTFNLLYEGFSSQNRSRLFLVPDFALYLHFSYNKKREGVIWCLRNDIEKNNNNAVLLELIRNNIQRLKMNEKELDTYVGYSISLADEKDAVFSLIQQFSSAQIIVTDRLHGMLYSVITDTPVIALDNLNGKVGQVYNLWLKDISSVHYIEHLSQVNSFFENFTAQSCNISDLNQYKMKYEPIIHLINGVL